MYREMTPEEKLEYSSEIIEAIKTDGLIGSLKVVDKYKKKLSNENSLYDYSSQIPETIITTPFKETTDISVENIPNISEIEKPSTEASIYAQEHISAVQEDLREQNIGMFSAIKAVEPPKTKVLEVAKSHAPNPWGDAQIVSPGQLNL